MYNANLLNIWIIIGVIEVLFVCKKNLTSMWFSAPNTEQIRPGACSGMVRVVYNPEPGSDRRALIKGMKGEVSTQHIYTNYNIWGNA